MSVLVSNRKESKFEAITFSEELHSILIDLMQRGFGVKDLDQFVRLRYAYGKDCSENFSKYRYLMQNFKNRIDQIASLLTGNLRAANSIYPTSMYEYDQRRGYQNNAIANCEQLVKELQKVVEIFDGFKVDVSYMTDEEYSTCMNDIFNKLEYRQVSKVTLTGEKFMDKSVNIGDQLSQVIGIYYPYPIDNYVKYVKSQKYYGRYMDDWYLMSPSKEELSDILGHIRDIAADLGIHLNEKKTRIVKIHSTYKYLQVKYTLTDSGKIIKRINPERVTYLRRKLKKLALKVKNRKLNYNNVENLFKGWMGSFYKLLSKHQRKNLIALYEELFEKTITIENKKMNIIDRG